MKHILVLLLAPQHLQLLSQSQHAFICQKSRNRTTQSFMPEQAQRFATQQSLKHTQLLPMPKSICQAVEVLTRPIWGSLSSIGTAAALPWPTFLPLMVATGAAKSSPALLAAALPLTLLTFTFLLTSPSTACSSDVMASASSTCGHEALRVVARTLNMSVYWLACTASQAGFASLTSE